MHILFATVLSLEIGKDVFEAVDRVESGSFFYRNMIYLVGFRTEESILLFCLYIFLSCARADSLAILTAGASTTYAPCSLLFSFVLIFLF